MNTIIIGVYLTTSKKDSISWTTFLDACEKYNTDNIIHNNYIEVIDINENNYNEIKFNKIICKLDEYYIERSLNQKLISYLACYPNLIDPVTHQINVGNRSFMASKLSEICLNFDNLFVPKYTYMKNSNYCPDLEFPLICKPNAAFGSSFTHSMCIVKNYDTLVNANLHYPLLLQNFHEHDALIFKVYVINKHTSICIKNSISIINNPDEVIYFDTSDLKKNPVSLDKDVISGLLGELSNSINLEKLNECISINFGLSLFGYDIIRVDDKYGIIDVNYFPGYTGFGEFHKYLLEYLIE